MSLPIPDLDDQSYDSLVEEARAMIPRHLPEWTDHNPSDPGVTLMELFAFLFDNAGYRINRIPDRTFFNFAGLVSVAAQPGEGVDPLLRRVLDDLNCSRRAVTAADHESLVLAETFDQGTVARVKASVEFDQHENVFPADEIITVCLVCNGSDETAAAPSAELRKEVFDYLRKRKPIAAKLRVEGPEFHDVDVTATVVTDRRSARPEVAVRTAVEESVEAFLHALTGGPDGSGWPFGRPVHRSEIFQQIERVVGVDHVRQLSVSEPPKDWSPVSLFKNIVVQLRIVPHP